MNAIISKIFLGFIGIILISVLATWLFWEEFAHRFKSTNFRSSEPGLIFAAIFSN